MPKLQSYRNRSRFIFSANHLTSFYIMATLAFNELTKHTSAISLRTAKFQANLLQTIHVQIVYSNFWSTSSPEQFLKNNPGTDDFARNFNWFDWFVNRKTIEYNLCDNLCCEFSIMADLSSKENAE